MKDRFGKELKVGQVVAYATNFRGLVIMKITDLPKGKRGDTFMRGIDLTTGSKTHYSLSPVILSEDGTTFDLERSGRNNGS